MYEKAGNRDGMRVFDHYRMPAGISKMGRASEFTHGGAYIPMLVKFLLLYVYKRRCLLMVDRTSRISEEMKKEISGIIQNELKDPRLPRLISVTSVNVTKDLRYAKVYVSVMGSDEDKKNALSGLKSAAGFIRREVGRRIQMRYTPEIQFEIDNSIEHGVYITKLINETMKE